MRIAPSRFGHFIHFEEGDLPLNTTALIVTRNTGGGRQPYRLILPHQLYFDQIKGHFATEFEVYPVTSDQPFLKINLEAMMADAFEGEEAMSSTAESSSTPLLEVDASEQEEHNR